MRGLLIGPPAAPFAYWAGAMVHAWWSGFHVGAAILFALRRFGRLNAATLIATGALGAVLGALAAAAGWLAGVRSLQ